MTEFELLQKKHGRLVEKIRMMRGCQREYFKYRARSDLDRAKRLEYEVDNLISEEVKLIKSQQKQLKF